MLQYVGEMILLYVMQMCNMLRLLCDTRIERDKQLGVSHIMKRCVSEEIMENTFSMFV